MDRFEKEKKITEIVKQAMEELKALPVGEDQARVLDRVVEEVRRINNVKAD